jgi:hypothetical protein
VLTLDDGDAGDVIYFYGSDPDAAPGIDLDLVVDFQIGGSTLHNADTGVRFLINDGDTRSATFSCVEIAGLRGIGIAGTGSASDPGTYLAFVAHDWVAPTTLRLRRWASGDAEIIEVNGVAPSPRAIVNWIRLATRTRAGATIEFGCMSPEALTIVNIRQLYSERPATAVAGNLTFTHFRIRDDDTTDRLRFRADYTLGSGSDGIDPAAEGVTLKLSTPAGGQFYPSPDFNPIHGFQTHGNAPHRRWTLTAAEKARTGIEQLEITEGSASSGNMFLRDRSINLPDGDYSTVNAEVTIGSDRLTGTVHLVEKKPGSGKWRMV